MLLQYRLGCSEAFTYFSSVRDMRLIPELGRRPRIGNDNPVQYSCLKILWTEENGRQQSWGSDCKESDMTERFHTHTHIWGNNQDRTRSLPIQTMSRPQGSGTSEWEKSGENALLSGIWFSVGKRKEFGLECKMNIVGRGMSAHFLNLAKENYQWHSWRCTEGLTGVDARIPEHYLSTLNGLKEYWSRKIHKGLLYYWGFNPQKKSLMQKLCEEDSKESLKRSVCRIRA